MALAVLFSFSWNSCVTQTHLHFADRVQAAEPGRPAVGALVRTPVRRKLPPPCPICRELIHAARYLPGAAPVLAPVAVAAAPTPAEADRLAGGGPVRSHAWRSRAPPLIPVLS